MKILALLLFLIGCADYNGLNLARPSTDSGILDVTLKSSDSGAPNILPQGSDAIPECIKKQIATIEGCPAIVLIPSPGVTENIYLYIDNYTDGAKPYNWYPIEDNLPPETGQYVYIIQCSKTTHTISVSYGCVP